MKYKNIIPALVAVLSTTTIAFSQEDGDMPAMPETPELETPSSSDWSLAVSGDYFDFESGSATIGELIKYINGNAGKYELDDRSGDMTGGTISLGWSNQLFFDYSFSSGDSESNGGWYDEATDSEPLFYELVTFTEDWQKLRVRWDVAALSGSNFQGYLSGGYQKMSGDAIYTYRNQVDDTDRAAYGMDSDATFASIGFGMALNMPAGSFNLGVIGEIQGVFGNESSEMRGLDDAFSPLLATDERLEIDTDDIFAVEYTVTGYVNYPFNGGAVFMNVGYRLVSWGDGEDGSGFYNDGEDGSGFYNDGDLKGLVARVGVKFNF